VRKIKGFKLPLRPHEFKRRAKKAGVDLEAAGLGPEPVLLKFLDRASKSLNAGVLFDTFAHPDPDVKLLSPMPGLAYSVVLASLGAAFEPIKEKEASIPAALWPVLEETGLDEAVRFASNLLADDAEKDNCELSPINELSSADAVEAAVRKLDGSKLGVGVEGGRLVPAASVCVSLSWLAKSKAKGRK
jgi:hypothetical protein